MDKKSSRENYRDKDENRLKSFESLEKQNLQTGTF